MHGRSLVNDFIIIWFSGLVLLGKYKAHKECVPILSQVHFISTFHFIFHFQCFDFSCSIFHFMSFHFSLQFCVHFHFQFQNFEFLNFMSFNFYYFILYSIWVHFISFPIQFSISCFFFFLEIQFHLLFLLLLFCFFLGKGRWVEMMIITRRSYTVRPRLSGHIGSSAYPDKWFGRIWEICLNTASSVGLNTSYNLFTHCYSICNKLSLMYNGLDNKIKQIQLFTVFNYFVFVLSKTVKSVVGNRQYTARSWPDNRDIQITDGRITEVQLYWYYATMKT